MAMMSPASAFSTGTRSRPRKASSLVMRVCSITLPSRRQHLQRHVGPTAPGSMRPGQHAAEKGVVFEDGDQHAERRVGLDRAAPAHGAGSGRTAATGPCARPSSDVVRPALAAGGDTASGKSSCASLAPSAANRSKTSSCTSCGRASDAVDLVDHDDRAQAQAQRLADHELGLRQPPSAASTSSTTPSTMFRMRSTSPPKSAWPGVSTMLIARALPHHRGALGQDGDAALALQVVAVHRAFGHLLVVAEGAGLAAAGGRPAWSCRGRRGR